MSTANVNCGCSGIRYCAHCLESNRVISINFVDESSLFAGLKCCVFSFHDRRAHFVPTLFYNSTLSEIYMEIDANSNHVCTADCISMDGVLIMKDFLSTDEEQNIINKIDKGKWKFSQSGRLKQDYGPKVNFKQKKIKLDNFSGLPEYTDTLLFKINELHAEELNGFIPVELCNLDYSPKRLSSINMHIDDHWIWGERLISINLLSDSLITLQNLKKKFLVFLPLYRRSLLCLNGDQRFLWQHAILSHHITERRVVITLREAAREFLEGGEQYEQIGRELIDKSRRRLTE